MKNTTENKTKFIAQYWGQTVQQYTDDIVLVSTIKHWGLTHPKDVCLILKPFSQISEDLALELIEIRYPNSILSKSIVRITKSDNVLQYEWRTTENRFGVENIYLKHLSSEQADVLRLNGFAIPWNGLSVDEQIEFGWIKLK